MSGIFNRRNALIGYLAMAIGRRQLRKKLQAEEPPEEAPEPKKRHTLRKLLIVSAVVGGAYAVWRKVKGGGETYEYADYQAPYGGAGMPYGESVSPPAPPAEPEASPVPGDGDAPAA